jgi:hypothetical protein
VVRTAAPQASIRFAAHWAGRPVRKYSKLRRRTPLLFFAIEPPVRRGESSTRRADVDVETAAIRESHAKEKRQKKLRADSDVSAA